MPLAALLILFLLEVAGAAEPGSRANRLADETSPYLLLHAYNPVDWYPWGPEALERAPSLRRSIV